MVYTKKRSCSSSHSISMLQWELSFITNTEHLRGVIIKTLVLQVLHHKPFFFFFPPVLCNKKFWKYTRGGDPNGNVFPPLLQTSWFVLVPQSQLVPLADPSGAVFCHSQQSQLALERNFLKPSHLALLLFPRGSHIKWKIYLGGFTRSRVDLWMPDWHIL